MFTFIERNEMLQHLIGKEIESVEEFENFDENGIQRVVFKFTDGTTVDISCSSYNYGSQELNIETE